ncbi:MAG TPA: serine/threonine-protein kinase [Polyangiaceae bacterium]
MDAPISIGDVLAGKYRVERVLGVGGMGVVVAAEDLLLERRVAIKFLLDDGLQNPEVLARFGREARSAVRIESEHVARVIDVGSLPNGSPYIVMEYLEGKDLAQHVAAQGALPVEESVDYLLQACEAIAEAHALGIVHRDLKPANLFLTRRTDGTVFVKVLDFGISKAVSGARGSQPDVSLTKTSAVMGSPLYMAPEQMRSTRTVDARADIWALGVILYELVSGKVPFEATAMPELCALVLTEAPMPLDKRCPSVPTALAGVVARCLEKEPAQRFANISELANALAGFGPQKARLSAERISRVLRAAGVDTHPITQQTDSALPAERPGEATSAAWSPGTTGSVRRASALPVIAVGALLLLGAGVGTVFLMNGRKASLDASTASAPAAPLPPAVSVEPVAAPLPSLPVGVAPETDAIPANSAVGEPSSPIASAGTPAAPAVVAQATHSGFGKASKPSAPTPPSVVATPVVVAPVVAAPVVPAPVAEAPPIAAPPVAPAPPPPAPPKKRNALDIVFK